eukprot:2852792-Heterocapsa_arctica.AAC.1
MLLQEGVALKYASAELRGDKEVDVATVPGYRFLKELSYIDCSEAAECAVRKDWAAMGGSNPEITGKMPGFLSPSP